MEKDFLSGKDIDRELMFTASRSSGPGGQNVNKVNTRVELRFDVGASQILTEEEKKKIFEHQASKITKDGILIVVSQSGRTQLENREKAVKKLHSIINRALFQRKKRIQTKRTKASKQKRLDLKKQRSVKKQLRKPVEDF